jgi:hypothetical protein
MPRHRWEDNIRMDIMDIRWEGIDWNYLGRRGISFGLL